MTGFQAMARDIRPLLPETAEELAHWRELGRAARFWWRDDDAVSDSPALRRMIGQAETSGLPLALAVIPGRLEESLVGRVAASRSVDVMQHGLHHLNHAAPGGKKSEFGPDRDVAESLADLRAGRETLASAFGDGFIPWLAPPWNRIDPIVTARLGEAGIRGVSLYGDAPKGMAANVAACHTHLDIIDWKSGGGFVGTAALDGLFAAALRRRRSEEIAANAPIGLLTHHLVHDSDCVDFLDGFAAFVRGEPALECPRSGELFGNI
jgi:hypothetical protein